MINRYSHTLPWSVSKLGQPSDLPDVLREDLLLIVPVDPSNIFATWNISYQTQNQLAANLGENAFASSRLVIRLEDITNSEASLIYDVSGPHRSRYLPVSPSLVKENNYIRLRAQLGYLSADNQFYTITGSNAVLLPTGQSCGVQTELPSIYTGACHVENIGLTSADSSEHLAKRVTIDLEKMANLLDLQLGRAPMPEGIHPQL
ncbi:TPA: hypothetical protein DD394_01270 [bacterium UBP9_UBA11836]|nr:hypothetical protein [bacterium UBP9_UBA11836]